MAKKRRVVKRLQKWLKRNKKPALFASIALLLLSVVLYNSMNDNYLAVDTKTVRPLLGLIAKAESNGNYNAYFNNGGNTKIKFTQMPIRDVQAWQANYVAEGSASSAVGRYQFIDTTLAGLIRELGLDGSQKFDETIQDQLAVQLLKRRGVTQYVNKELTREQFAANLAQEWAALPSVIGPDPSSSYYAGDGLNKSRVSVDEVLQVVDEIKLES